MLNPYEAINTRTTPQSRKAASNQVKNSAGGYTFGLTDVDRLKRFLILGSDAPTYYALGHELTFENFEVVQRMATADSKTLVDTIVEISVAGRAPRVQPALFALAVAASHGTVESKRYALDQLSAVARTGSHLFTFLKYVQQFRGWGSSLTRAVSTWYMEKDVDTLAYQMVKYRHRWSWTHRDVLRKAHPKASMQAGHNALFKWATSGTLTGDLPDLVATFTSLQDPACTARLAVALIESARGRISWEMLPNHLQSEPKVWGALIEQGMPMTALMRQLPRLTRLGLMSGDTAVRVASRLSDEFSLRQARIHPVSVLLAQRTYASGRGRGSEWTPVPAIVDALDAGFYASFGNVVPAGKRTLLGIDVSASMDMRTGSDVTARELAAAMSLVTMKTEPGVSAIGFTSGGTGYYRSGGPPVTSLDLSPRRRLDDVIRYMRSLPFGGTDCALPMLWATANKMEVDTFIVMTDNETWAGKIHPFQALRQYREKSGIDAKLIVAGFTSTGFTIADPSDSGMLDVVGTDSAIPNLIADFSAGR